MCLLRKGHKMFTKIAGFLLGLVLLAAPMAVQAGDALVTRVDAGVGRTPGYSIGYILADGPEFWSFANGSDLEIGRLWSVYGSKHSFVLLGGYAALWPDADELFFVPWMSAGAWKGRIKASVDVAGYLPVNGGPTALLLSDAFVGYRVTGRVALGVGSGVFQVSDYLKGVPIGPSVKVAVDKRTNLQARYLFGESGQNSFRLQINRGF